MYYIRSALLNLYTFKITEYFHVMYGSDVQIHFSHYIIAFNKIINLN